MVGQNRDTAGGVVLVPEKWGNLMVYAQSSNSDHLTSVLECNWK